MEIFRWTLWNVVQNEVEQFIKMGYILISIPNGIWKLSNPHLLTARAEQLRRWKAVHSTMSAG